MKRIVVYESGTGFTAKYAGWIAQRLGCEAKKFKNVKQGELETYDLVVYGGWIMAGMITGFNKIKTLNLKNLVVFAVGMSVSNDEVAERIAQQNQIERERLFYYEGGCKPEKLGFMKKMMLKMVKKSLEKKADKTADDLHMLETFKGADNTDKAAIEELIKYCEQI